MSSLKLFRLRFDTPIKRYELPEFRDVITDYLGFTGMYIVEGNWQTAGDLIDFEGEVNPPVQLTYPLLQWRLQKYGSGHTPGLICLSDRLDDVEQSLLQNCGNTVIVNGRPYPIWCRTPEHETVEVSTGGKMYPYRIWNYLPIEGKNHKAFENIQDWSERRHLVGRMLLNHLMLFSKAVSAELKQDLSLENLTIHERGTAEVAGQSFPSFQMTFMSNLNIPAQVGLGCKSGLGYGVVESLTQ